MRKLSHQGFTLYGISKLMMATKSYRQGWTGFCNLVFILVAWITASITVAAQALSDTLRQVDMDEVTVTALRDEAAASTSFNLLPVTTTDPLSSNYNLSDLLASTPGVRMLSTGVAIAKPVIRGLFGNRVLILLNGLKFDNQQWQEEHGLGLSDLGLSKLEVIKGPMSVLYGTEAIAGVINLVEETKPAYQEKQWDYGVKVHSNTTGGMIQGGYQANLGSKWIRFRAGVENNADYTDGNGNRVLNSRFDGYYLKGSYGFQKGNWVSNNYVSSSFNRFGFIFNDVYTFIEADARQSRRLNVNPAHLVLLNTISSDNRIYFPSNAKLTINAGIQSNERLENEGGGAISLNMHLLTGQCLVKWEKQINENHTLLLSGLGVFEDNTNYGARKIVPDAYLQESNLSAYWIMHLHTKIIWENGIAVGQKWVKTFFTPGVNSPDKDIQPFSKFEPFYNALSGVSFLPGEHLNLKLNVSTGVRVPNLAELSSNGLHEGIFTYEIGNPDFANERVISVNGLLDYQPSGWKFSLSPFYNHFNHFVYLAPTEEQWFGFPVYRFRQQDANQYGFETFIAYRPVENTEVRLAYEYMNSRTVDGLFTPFLPPSRLQPGGDLTWTLKGGATLHADWQIDYVFAQDRVYRNEVSTPDYWLVHAGISTDFNAKKASYTLSLVGDNLLNTAYYDHLSRFKDYGLLNMGRNFTLACKVNFNAARQ